MKDRLPLYPGRFKLVPVSGQENVYDMTRADQPTQQGDPLNKATLLKDTTAALFGLGTDAVPDDVLAMLSKAALYKETPTAQIGTLDVGTTIYIEENNISVPYIIVNHGKPQNSSLYDSSCNGTWVLRKDIYKIGEWRADASNNPIGADIYSSMEEMLNLYGHNVKDSIKTVKIPYCVGGRSATVNSGANGLQCKIFPLGGYEVGWTTSTNSVFPVDGAVLSYFKGTASTDEKRVSKYENTATQWWTRSPQTNSGNNVIAVGINGQPNYNSAVASLGFRPGFILPDSFIANIDKNPSGLYDVLGKFLLKLPGVQIATGSYVGTGKYGGNNPNSLTFQAKPKKVSIVGAYINSASSPGYGQHYNEAAFYCDVISGEYTSAGYGYLNYGGYQYIGGSDYESKLVGNTLSWYNTSRAEYQFNESGVKYYYFAIL